MTKRPYVPAPVNMNAIDRTIAQSIAAIERSCALLSRLDAASTIITCADVPSLNRLVLIETNQGLLRASGWCENQRCRLFQVWPPGYRKALIKHAATMGARVGVRKQRLSDYSSVTRLSKSRTARIDWYRPLGLGVDPWPNGFQSGMYPLLSVMAAFPAGGPPWPSRRLAWTRRDRIVITYQRAPLGGNRHVQCPCRETTVTSVVMAAAEKESPATNGTSDSRVSKSAQKSATRSLLLSVKAGICWSSCAPAIARPFRRGTALRTPSITAAKPWSVAILCIEPIGHGRRRARP